MKAEPMREFLAALETRRELLQSIADLKDMRPGSAIVVASTEARGVEQGRPTLR